MRKKSVWRRLLGVEDAVIKRVEFDENGTVVVASVNVPRRLRERCGRCGRRSGQ